MRDWMRINQKLVISFVSFSVSGLTIAMFNLMLQLSATPLECWELCCEHRLSLCQNMKPKQDICMYTKRVSRWCIKTTFILMPYLHESYTQSQSDIWSHVPNGSIWVTIHILCIHWPRMISEKHLSQPQFVWKDFMAFLSTLRRSSSSPIPSCRPSTWPWIRSTVSARSP